jgi:hypothetical protein
LPAISRIVLLGAAATILHAQPRYFGGLGTGIATLSGDARAEVGAGGGATSLYDAKNGLLVQVFGGRHWNDYLSAQGGYTWNRSDVTITSSLAGPRPAFRQDTVQIDLHQASADLMLYFRDRRSWVRPYLSGGFAVARFTGIESTKAGLRAAAGIDLVHRSGWGFRYCFVETLSGNPLAERMQPRGRKKLMNFQNVFGLLKQW